LNLRDSGVRYIAAELPNSDETVVGIMAVIACARGTRWPWPANGSLSKAGPLAIPNVPPRCAGLGGAIRPPSGSWCGGDKRAEDLRETILDVVASESLSHAAIAAELNRAR
jgi:hypothetical protein